MLTPGLGAVATTFIAGVESVRRGLSKPIGSLTQMATIRLGQRAEKRSPLIREFVPLAGLDDIVFGAWDPIPDDAYTSAKQAGVLEDRHLEPLREFLQSRVKAYLEEQGFRYDVVEAVVGAINSAAGPGAGARNGTGAGADVPADMADRAAALAAFRETDGFADAVIAFGRAANLGGRSPEREVDPRLLKDPAEVALNKGFQEVRGRAREMLATHR